MTTPDNALRAYCHDVGPDFLDLMDRDGSTYRLPMVYKTGVKLDFFLNYVKHRWVDVDFATGFVGVEPLFGIPPIITLTLVWFENDRHFKILACPWGDPCEVGR